MIAYKKRFAYLPLLCRTEVDDSKASHDQRSGLVETTFSLPSTFREFPQVIFDAPWKENESRTYFLYRASFGKFAIVARIH